MWHGEDREPALRTDLGPKRALGRFQTISQASQPAGYPGPKAEAKPGRIVRRPRPRPDRGGFEPLRSFLAVAEELHFTRAAARLYLAQQAVSRHVRRLEEELGVELFDRTTRQVELTAAGRRLLPAAQRLLALHDRMVEEARGDSRPLLVDTMAEGLSPTILVEEARRAAPQIEFLMRFSGGVGSAMANLESRQVGRSGGRREAGIPFDGRHLVRLERWPTTAISIIPASNTFTAPPGRRSRGWDG